MFGATRKPITSLTRQTRAEKEEAQTGWTADLRTARRSWHLGSDAGFAGPTQWDAWKPWRSVGTILREKGRKPPPGLVVTPRWRAERPEEFSGSMKTAADVTAFWLGPHGWQGLRPAGLSEEWVRGLFRCGAIGIGLRTPEGELVATAISVPHEGDYLVGGQAVKKDVRDLVGIVVHRELRGRGIASWLFAWLDHFTSKGGPVVHAAEAWMAGRGGTGWASLSKPITTARIMSLRRDRLPRAVGGRGQVDRVRTGAALSVLDVLHDKGLDDYSVFALCKTCSGISWWRSQVADYPSCSVLAAVKTWEIPQGWDIWKRGGGVGAAAGKGEKGRLETVASVVFYCIVRTRPGSIEDMYDPFWDDESSWRVKGCMEQICIELDCDRLVVMDLMTRGDTGCLSWEEPWSSEPLVSWSAFMYNMIPPALGRGNICWIY